MSEGPPGHFVGDRYHIVRELGRGGMGVVYLGRDLRLEMDVAIKFRGVVHANATLWLKREFRSVASLRHPNLVELYELVAHDQNCYFTMEYLPGVDPRRWVERGTDGSRPIHDRVISDDTTRSAVALGETSTAELAPGLVAIAPPSVRTGYSVDFGRLREVLAQLAEGLAFLHARGVIHRDVKPSNVIVVGGTVKLLDFGLALERHRQTEDVARESRIVGTAAYLAPEYLERLVVSPQMDVYALGVVAYELATGQPPFGGTLHVVSRLHHVLKIPRASEIVKDLPSDLDELISAMLSADPAARPSATEVAARLGSERSESSRRRSAARREAPFVGRAAELAQIAKRIADPTPKARLVLITGPSGAGKSALIDHALGSARDAATIAWRGRCHDRERVPYRAFDLIVDDLATELAGDPRLAQEIDHAAALARVFPVLAPLIDPVVAEEPPVDDLRVERERALLALAQMVAMLITAPRGVIVIDDLQWADDDSLELLALLVERVRRPLTVMATWTIDGAAPALAALRERLGAAAETVAVCAMDEADLLAMLAELAPGAPAERLVVAAKLAAGSPYLAELIGRELGEAGVADPQHAEQRRLDRLEPTERMVAEIAALAGGTTSFDQLRALAHVPSGRLQSVLRGLEDARVVRAIPALTGDPVYTFYHQRLREAANAAMTPEARCALHAKFAHWYETTGALDTVGDAGQLAYHWQHAGAPMVAARWAMRAGDAAHGQLAWGVAADWYARALQLVVATGAETRTIDVTHVRTKLADCLFLAGKLAAAADEFLVLAARDVRGGDRWRVRAAEAYLKLGELERGLGELDDVLARHGQKRTQLRVLSVARAAIVAARWLAPLPARTRAVDDVLAAAYRVIASFLSTPYPLESFEYVLRGVALAEQRGDRGGHAMGMAMLSAYVATGSLGRFGDRAVANAQRLAVQSGAPYPRMVAAGAAGMLATLRGNWTGMRIAHDDAEAVCKKLGLERSWEASFLRTYWALGELYAGEPARAEELLQGLEDTSEDLWTRAMLGSTRGRVLVLAGDLAAAHTLAAQLEGTPAAHQGMASIYRQVFLGELALAERDWQRAAARATSLTNSARAQWLNVMPAVGAMVDVISATADLGLGNAERARATARHLVRRGSASFYAATGLRLWAQAERMCGGDDRPLLARASAVASARGGKIDQLAIRALAGDAVDAGALAFAVAWSTAGMIGG